MKLIELLEAKRKELQTRIRRGGDAAKLSRWMGMAWLIELLLERLKAEDS